MCRKSIGWTFLALFVAACAPTLQASPVSTAIPLKSRVVVTANVPALSSTETVAGLSMITREIKGGAPDTDPLHFVTTSGESFDFLNMGQGDRFIYHWLNPAEAGLEVDLGGDKYIAKESYDNDGFGRVILMKNAGEIYRIDVGHGSPILALRGLWLYDDHWVLETNYYLDENPFNGKITEDGVLLNKKYGDEEMFGFQTIGGHPFYFFRKNGRIDAWYDGNLIPLGYEKIPHYSCCSPAELNPQARKNMVSFFGVRGTVWYFVQLGLPGTF
jgi:hypothetical protein